MSDWSKDLIGRLGVDFASMIGLTGEEDGAAFEQTMGRLTKYMAMIDEVDHFASFSKGSPYLDDGQTAAMAQRVQQQRNNFEHLESNLHESLFELFGPDEIDVEKATEAYFRLFDEIRLGPGPHSISEGLILATTNYDRAAELAFHSAGLPLRTGQEIHPTSTPVLRPEGLGKFVAGRSALMYLHGAVGWYRREDGEIACMPSDSGYQDVHGTPAVLYPDANKLMEDSITAAIWREFRAAATEATQILVLGHALNDRHIVEVLKEATAPVGVTYFDRGDAAHQHEQQRIESIVPGAHPIGVNFRAALNFDERALNEWLLDAEAKRQAA